MSGPRYHGRARRPGASIRRSRPGCTVSEASGRGAWPRARKSHRLRGGRGSEEAQRSALLRLGRLVLRFRMASCCHKARFSRASLRRGLRLDLALVNRAYSTGSMVVGWFDPERGHQRLRGRRRSEEAQAGLALRRAANSFRPVDSSWCDCGLLPSPRAKLDRPERLACSLSRHHRATAQRQCLG